MKYEIKSIKHTESFVGELTEAISRAKEIANEYDPAFGVQIENEDGDDVWTSEK